MTGTWLDYVLYAGFAVNLPAFAIFIVLIVRE